MSLENAGYRVAVEIYCSSVALYENEYAIDIELVSNLLADQAPQWSNLPIEPLETSGTVNVAFRLGDDKVVRLPRSSRFGDGPQREAIVLPRFGSKLPLDVPINHLLGAPTEAYPGHWSVLGWIQGTTANSSNLDDLERAASQLGEFVVALQHLPTGGAPEGGNYRAFGLARADDGFRKWVDQLPADIDRRSVLGTWQSCLAAGEWNGPPKWLHGDLRGDNLITRNGELVGVIDWEACTVGDPSVDYLAAWWLFDTDTRATFRNVAGAQDPDWLRAKGWALQMAVAAIPYYIDTNVEFAMQARRALGEILGDD